MWLYLIVLCNGRATNEVRQYCLCCYNFRLRQQPEQSEVAPELKQRFSDWVDQRTEKGVATYGEPLMTHNGRDAERDMTEELLDFCQYQQQHIMELKDR